MSITRVALDSTETIYSSPRVTRGRIPVLGAITSAYVRIGTPASSMPDEDTWTAATVASSTAVFGAHVEGDDTIALSSSPTTIRGMPYVIAPTDDGPFVVECGRSATTTAQLNLSTPLPCAVPANSPIYPFFCSVALTAAQTATAGPAVAMWKAVIDGQAIQWSSMLRIVRRMPVIPLTSGELQVAYPQVMRMRDVDDDALEELIATAWEHRVIPRIAAKGIREEDIVDSEPLRPLTALACLMHLVSTDESASQQWREALQVDFDRLVESTVGRVDWYEAPQEDAPTPSLVPSEPRRTGITVHR